MSWTNIKQAIRYLFTQRNYSLVIIVGLSVGMAASFLIYSYVYYEKSFDSFHQYGERLCRVVVTNKDGLNPYKSPYSYSPQGPVAVSEVPEVENYVRILSRQPIVISNPLNEGASLFTERSFYYADSTFFQLFTFPLTQGNPESVLSRPASVVISQSTARKLFGTKDPVGKELQVDGQYSCVVTGVFEDIPANSHLRFNMLFSMSSLNWIMGNGAWDNHSFFTYLLLKDGANRQDVESKITSAYLKEDRADNQAECEWKLQPVGDAYLKTADFTSKPEALKFGDNRIVYFLSLISVLVLCIAWVNYLNLTTARASERLKEIGVRRTNGAGKAQLLVQFFTESLMFNLLGMLLAGILVAIVYSWFTRTMGYSFSFMHSKGFWIMVSTLLSISFLLPGLISSLFLISHDPFQPRATAKSGSSGISFRNGLVIFQFIIIIGLMSGVIIVNRQLKYLHMVDLGFQKDQVLVLHAPRIGFNEEKYKAFYEELKKYPGINDVTASTSVPGERFGSGNGGPSLEGQEDNDTYFRVGRVMPNYLEFYGIKLIAGNGFGGNRQADDRSIIVNEEGVKEFGLQNPADIISKRVKWNGRECTVVGVTQSFHQQSLHILPEPMILYTMPFENTYNYLMVKGNAGNMKESIASIKDEYQAVFAGNPFDYFFLDHFFEQQYKKDIAFRELFSFFSAVALIIGFIGLYGLTTYRIIRSSKEIGIRKVNGARISEILAMLNKDFVKWVAIAFIIATPIAWYTMNKWLENFAYKTELSWWIFALAGMLALGIALLTVSWQSWKAATRNPVEALRYE